MRIGVVTQRHIRRGAGRYPAYGTWTEAENVLVRATDAELINVSMHIEHPRIRFRRMAGRTLRRLAGSEARVPATPGTVAGTVRELGSAGETFDLIVFVAYSVWDLQHLERMGLRRFGDRIVAWFFEIWPSAHSRDKVRLEPFHTVDDIFVAHESAVEPLSSALGRPVSYLPMATDAIRFSPPTPDAERPIDLIGIGGRRQEQHEAMLRWARDRDRFYLYDTTTPGRDDDDDRHRDNLGSWYSSSKLAVCNFAKSHDLDVVGDLRLVPGRLWEGLAAGAGLFGLPPDEDDQRHLFGAPVVEPIPPDPQQLPDFLEELLSRHGGAEAAARVRLALSGHDWAHRWISLFDAVDLPSPGRLEDRVEDLLRRAEKFA